MEARWFKKSLVMILSCRIGSLVYLSKQKAMPFDMLGWALLLHEVGP